MMVGFVEAWVPVKKQTVKRVKNANRELGLWVWGSGTLLQAVEAGTAKLVPE